MSYTSTSRWKMGRKYQMIRTLLLISLCILLLCTPVPGRTEKKELTIVTSFYPMYIHTLNITKAVPGIKVVNLTSPSVGCLHHYELTTDDMKNLSKASALVINGAGMEQFAEKLGSRIRTLRIIDAGRGIKPIQEGGHQNAHLWLSPRNAAAQVKNISEALGELDPSHKALYRKNSETYCTRLLQLNREFSDGLKKIRQRQFISFHRAFDYLARDYNLKVAAVIRVEPTSEPSAKEIAAIISLMKKSGVHTIFVEPQYPSATAESIARETGARVYTLDTAVNGPMEPGAYLRLMKKNLATLKEALK